MTLHYYIARRFFWILASVFAIFFAFMTLLDLVEQMRRFDSSVSFGEVLRLTLLNTPKSLYQILPLVVILSAIALFIGLARSSELVVIRAAGRSATSSLLAPVMVALILGGLAVGVFNPIVAATSKQYNQMRELYRNGGTSTLSIGAEGLWLRQGDETGQTVIRASRANPEATVLYQVSFVSYAPGGGPVQRIEADTARLDNGHWVLDDAKVWPLSATLNAEAAAKRFDSVEVSSTLTQESIRDRFGTPSAVPIWELRAYIAELELAGFSARRHFVWLQMEMAKPLFLAAMVLVGAAFTMGHSRLGKTGIGVLSAILLGFGLYYVRNFAQILGENGQVNAVLAAWAPPVASVLLAFGLILHREEG
ncbi:LPS export ABC transporter permease LptG [Pseudoprimorskyibacter insulae]|uniref:Lipopolysaccharide export system permease protein LptG n=1 Tax=Pseudoprimorskyibacter insulae TaxID=1695997 RepID=A0A2R8AVX5_9RHOB|nr:LPS export ABC transporter permease LptG [Pseudoprimorskyibacter insulae]SPF80185.1 Lipopolysaccharide export system permease protein LptG [Pseudoprimorskyibacter insulae]